MHFFWLKHIAIGYYSTAVLIETAMKIRIYALHFLLYSTCCPYRNSYENKMHYSLAEAYSNRALAAPIETAMKIKCTMFFD
jgi:hypothetical protein